MPVVGRTGPKRIQRGLITFASGDLQASNTIQAIDINKSEIRWQGTGAGMARLWLQNATTIWAVRVTSGTVQDVQWEITEW
jgi:hypothetical protein